MRTWIGWFVLLSWLALGLTGLVHGFYLDSYVGGLLSATGAGSLLPLVGLFRAAWVWEQARRAGEQEAEAVDVTPSP